MGFAGVALLAGLGPVPLSAATLLAVAGSLLAAFFYGIAAVYIKLRAEGDSPRVLTLYSLLGASLVLAPLVPFSLPPGRPPSSVVVISVLLLSLVSTAFAYLIYFRLIAAVGPTPDARSVPRMATRRKVGSKRRTLARSIGIDGFDA